MANYIQSFVSCTVKFSLISDFFSVFTHNYAGGERQEADGRRHAMSFRMPPAYGRRLRLSYGVRAVAPFYPSAIADAKPFRTFAGLAL